MNLLLIFVVLSFIDNRNVSVLAEPPSLSRTKSPKVARSHSALSRSDSHKKKTTASEEAPTKTTDGASSSANADQTQVTMEIAEIEELLQMPMVDKTIKSMCAMHLENAKSYLRKREYESALKECDHARKSLTEDAQIQSLPVALTDVLDIPGIAQIIANHLSPDDIINLMSTSKGARKAGEVYGDIYVTEEFKKFRKSMGQVSELCKASYAALDGSMDGRQKCEKIRAEAEKIWDGLDWKLRSRFAPPSKLDICYYFGIYGYWRIYFTKQQQNPDVEPMITLKPGRRWRRLRATPAPTP